MNRSVLLGIVLGGVAFGAITALTWPDGPAIAHQLVFVAAYILAALEVRDLTTNRKG